MPDPCAYDSESDFVSACISERQDENPDEDNDQSTAICFQMWRDRDCNKSMKSMHKVPAGIIHKAASVQSVGEREAIFIISTDTPDRHGDVVQQNWSFKDFMRNPVLLFGHDQQMLPIGKVIKRPWTEGGITYAHTRGLPEGADDFTDKVWRMIKEDFLSAVSVGFLPLEPPQERLDKKTGEWLGWIWPKNALLELSVVSVPANPEATAVAKNLNFSDQDMERLFCGSKACTPGLNAARRFVETQRLRVGA